MRATFLLIVYGLSSGVSWAAPCQPSSPDHSCEVEETSRHVQRILSPQSQSPQSYQNPLLGNYSEWARFNKDTRVVASCADDLMKPTFSISVIVAKSKDSNKDSVALVASASNDPNTNTYAWAMGTKMEGYYLGADSDVSTQVSSSAIQAHKMNWKCDTIGMCSGQKENLDINLSTGQLHFEEFEAFQKDLPHGMSPYAVGDLNQVQWHAKESKDLRCVPAQKTR